MPIKVKWDNNEKDLLFVTEKLFSFGAQKPAKYKRYSLPLCLWDETKDTKDTISKKENYCKLFKLLKKSVKVSQEGEN